MNTLLQLNSATQSLTHNLNQCIQPGQGAWEVVADLSGSRGEDASGCRGCLAAGICVGRQFCLNLSDGGTQGRPQGLQALAHLCCDGRILLINLLLSLQTDRQMLMHASIHPLCILPQAEAGAVLSAA